MANPKTRADQLLHDQGLAASRDEAMRLIMAGRVSMEHKGKLVPVEKPGHMIPVATRLLLADGERFVSRGGYKLLTAIERFGLDVRGLIALDVGASTGGFTDCLLQHGAAKVYAVDVGKSQLHEKLRSDPRVLSLEGVNFRLAGPDLLPEPVDFAVADVSFISLTRILGPMAGLLKPGGRMVVLVKPQFELGPERAVRGVVRDREAQWEAVDLVAEHARHVCGLERLDVVPAAVKGPKGNQEYLLLLGRA